MGSASHTIVIPTVLRQLLGRAVVILCLAGNYTYAKTPANEGPQIEYIAPDGKFSSLSAVNPTAHQAAAAFIDGSTVTCALKEGETTFIIELPAAATSDRFTFLNENAAACGELRIAVSDSPLPADSPKWTQVDGIVPFAHKRLFKLSMLGVETKFVRLSFKVDGQETSTARISHPFRSSILDENDNPARTSLISRIPRELNLATISVGPISPFNAK
jgi:hypothetical protein